VTFKYRPFGEESRKPLRATTSIYAYGRDNLVEGDQRGKARWSLDTPKLQKMMSGRLAMPAQCDDQLYEADGSRICHFPEQRSRSVWGQPIHFPKFVRNLDRIKSGPTDGRVPLLYGSEFDHPEITRSLLSTATDLRPDHRQGSLKLNTTQV